MQKRVFVLILLLVFCVPCFYSYSASQSEIITLTTYYPSPSGIYQNLTVTERVHFTPLDVSTIPGASLEQGDVAFDSGSGNLQYYTGTTWKDVAKEADTNIGHDEDVTSEVLIVPTAGETAIPADTLSCSISVENNDYILVQLEVEFTSDGETAIYPQLTVGSAVSQDSTNNAVVAGDTMGGWFSGSTMRIFQATGDGSLTFAMRYDSSASSSSVRNRSIRAWTIGR